MQPFLANEDQIADDDFLAKKEWIALRLNEILKGGVSAYRSASVLNRTAQ